MPNRGVTARPILIVGALAMALVLIGCSTPTTPSGGTGGDGGSGGTNGRPGTSQDDTGSGDSSDDSGSEGSGDGGIGDPLTGRLPADWPADVVVPEGEIVQSLSMGSSWLALINVADTTTAFASSSASLQAAGYAVVSEIVTDHGAVGVYDNAERQVQVSVATDPQAGWTMSYTITEKG